MNNFTKNILKENIEFSYTKKGEIKVLVSPGYGAGWSTWNSDSINLAVDKRIVDFFELHGKNIKRQQLVDFLESIGYEDVYVGGWWDIVIKTVKPNDRFIINEYDGSESLISFSEYYVWEL